MFGEGSVTLPDGVDRPPHWPAAEADLLPWEFDAEWRRWRDDPDAYVPPERRGEKE